MLEETNPYADRLITVPKQIEVRPVEQQARFILRVSPDRLAPFDKALGARLSPGIGDLTVADDLLVACLGPDEWYICTAAAKADALVKKFNKLGEKEPHSLVDVSHRETCIDVRGARATWLLNAASPLDLEVMAAPGAARTIFERVQIILFKLAPDHYRIEVWNSFADHVWGLLAAASHELETL